MSSADMDNMNNGGATNTPPNGTIADDFPPPQTEQEASPSEPVDDTRPVVELFVKVP